MRNLSFQILYLAVPSGSSILDSAYSNFKQKSSTTSGEL